MRGMDEPRSFPQFWTFYVLAHRQPLTRNLHTVGTLTGWLLLALAIVLRRPWFVLAALVVPYAFAWFSHFFVEHNRPATFGHPLWSLFSDFRMFGLFVSGRLRAHLVANRKKKNPGS